MEKNYIDRDLAAAMLENELPASEDRTDAVAMILAFPAADVQEVRHGKWEQRGSKIYCSYCNNGFAIRYGARPMSVYPYCPVCGSVRTSGAEMDRKEIDE